MGFKKFLEQCHSSAAYKLGLIAGIGMIGCMAFLSLKVQGLMLENRNLQTELRKTSEYRDSVDRKIKLANALSQDVLKEQFYIEDGRLFGVDLNSDPDFLIHQITEIQNILELQNEVINNLPTFLPSEGYLSSRFGNRHSPFTNKKALHKGLDIAASKGTPVYAAAQGVVRVAGFAPSYGKFIEIDHGNGFVTRYAHNSKVVVEPRQIVRKGELIAKVGSTGRSTGPHLHYEVWVNGAPLDPEHFFYNKPDDSGLLSLIRLNEGDRDDHLIAKSDPETAMGGEEDSN